MTVDDILEVIQQGRPQYKGEFLREYVLARARTIRCELDGAGVAREAISAWNTIQNELEKDEQCGYCTHPCSELIAGEWICGLCGAVCEKGITTSVPLT